ncbi:hypothetical protein FRB93_004144 [Tulasnella sp. JGI-2019a]|nr:hypothetical protein FRB93_004144 [Tulasnella sp. JGI-2019a]
MALFRRQIVSAITQRSTLASRRFLATQHGPSQMLRSRLSSRKVYYVATLPLGALLVTITPPTAATDESTTEAIDKSPTKTSMSALIRTYVVYSICSIPPLVTYAPAVLSFCQSIPGLKQIAEAFVRVTFFDQFVGADTAEGTLPLLKDFRAQHKGVLLAYSVEADEAAKATSQRTGGSEVPQYRRNVEEMLHSIEVAGNFEDSQAARPGISTGISGRKTWVAIKLSALVPSAESLSRFSEHLLKTRAEDRLVHYPGTPDLADLDVLSLATPPEDSAITRGDLDTLGTLREDLRRICMRAKARNVKLIMDAEYSGYQAAIDAFQLSLMMEFNTVGEQADLKDHVQPLVYGTYQAYLRRNTMHLLRSLELSKEGNFILGVKLVRGAYRDQEVGSVSPYEPDMDLVRRRMADVSKSILHKETDVVRLPEFKSSATSPVWNEKWETDGAYNSAALILVDQLKETVPSVGVLFGTHNKKSCDLIIRSLISNGLALVEKESSKLCVDERIVDRLMFGQLYGMSDALTDHLTSTLVSSSPMALKYVPYGSLREVIPYLGRRAIENKSVLGASDGGAVDERKRAGKEIWRRLTGGK